MKHTISILDPYNIRAIARVAYYNPTTKQLIATDTFRLHINSIELWESPLYFDSTGNEVTTIRTYTRKYWEPARKKTPRFYDSPPPNFPDITMFMDRTNHRNAPVVFNIPRIKSIMKDNNHAILHHDGSVTIRLQNNLTEHHASIFTPIPSLPDIWINLHFLLDGIIHLDPIYTIMEWRNELSSLHFSDATQHALIMPLKL